MALLSVIAVSLLSTSNNSYRLARNALEVARDSAVADAAVNRAALALLDPRLDQRWRLDGVAQPFGFEGTHVTIAIQDELGRIDLNQADAPLFVGLFQSVGLDAPSASGFADRILDWRDRSGLKRLNGANAQDYRAAGYAYAPRSGPFQSVDELKLVLGMNAGLFQRVEPALTVYSGRQFIDPQVAPREALLALPTMDRDKVAALIAARNQTNSAVSAGADPAAPLVGRAFTVRVEIDKPSGVLVREAAIRLTGDPAQPYWVLSARSR